MDYTEKFLLGWNCTWALRACTGLERTNMADMSSVSTTALKTAANVFGSQELATQWLARPALALDGRRPVDLLNTPSGIEEVITLLGRLDYGVLI